MRVVFPTWPILVVFFVMLVFLVTLTLLPQWLYTFALPIPPCQPQQHPPCQPQPPYHPPHAPTPNPNANPVNTPTPKPRANGPQPQVTGRGYQKEPTQPG